jgi:addiction module RelE/StbE family toxin
MYNVKFTTAYKKSYKLMKKRGLDLSLLDEVVDKLRRGIPLEEKNHDHELTGEFRGFRECHWPILNDLLFFHIDLCAMKYLVKAGITNTSPARRRCLHERLCPSVSDDG